MQYTIWALYDRLKNISSLFYWEECKTSKKVSKVWKWYSVIFLKYSLELECLFDFLVESSEEIPPFFGCYCCCLLGPYCISNKIFNSRKRRHLSKARYAHHLAISHTIFSLTHMYSLSHTHVFSLSLSLSMKHCCAVHTHNKLYSYTCTISLAWTTPSRLLQLTAF